MKIAFAGTPAFAAASLAALIEARLQICTVLTQPDRPAGRGRKLVASAVKTCAQEAGLPVWQPPSLKATAAQEELRALQPDLLVVIAYGQILPPAVLEIPRLGCVNLHASLLPRWRGAAPIQRAIQAGDEETGVCLMQMDAGLDTGPVLARAQLPIDALCTSGDLHDRLAMLGAARLPGWLQALARNELRPQVQDDARACYAHKLGKHEAQLDWQRPAAVLARQIRAFDPWPGASSPLAGDPLKLWRVVAVDEQDRGPARPGEITAVNETGMTVACAQGSLTVAEVQFAGGRRMRAVEAGRGRTLKGQILGQG